MHTSRVDNINISLWGGITFLLKSEKSANKRLNMLYSAMKHFLWKKIFYNDKQIIIRTDIYATASNILIFIIIRDVKGTFLYYFSSY